MLRSSASSQPSAVRLPDIADACSSLHRPYEVNRTRRRGGDRLGGFVRVFMILAGIALAGSTASARDARPSLQDSFRLGNARGALCQMQSRGADPVATGMFDRA